MYELGEGNRPEIWQTGGKLYGISGNSGKVFNQDQLSEVGGGSGVTININNAPEGTTVTQNGNTFDIDVAVKRAESNFVQQFNSKQGPMYSAMTRNTTATPRL